MPLLRGFSKVDPISRDPVGNGASEGGKIFIPSNIMDKAGISTGRLVEIKVIRIKGSSRWPHIIVHAPGVYPHLSMLQVVMMEERSQIDDEDRLILTDTILEETKLQPDSRVELKVVGPNHGSWFVIHNRGPNRLTTLQEKIGRQGKGARNEKKWKTMSIEY
ncbi:hypothetical protein KAW55_00125 [bacterium]|nr:hypothetical protein [bacterium]